MPYRTSNDCPEKQRRFRIPLIGATLRTLIHRLALTLGGFRILFGINPREAPPGSIIVFPWLSSTLCCGLAGIVTVKKRPPLEKGFSDAITTHFETVRSQSLEQILNHRLSPSAYLGGQKVLQLIERILLSMKTEAAFHQILETDAGRELADLSKVMEEFLLQEEALLESNAQDFSTAEMEIFNRALELLKDCVWALKNDILDNVRKTLDLANVEPAAKVTLPLDALQKYHKVNLLLNALDRIEVRGRDSAGIQITMTFEHPQAVDSLLTRLKQRDLYEAFIRRLEPGDLLGGSIQLRAETSSPWTTVITFTYKRASVTGHLGENTDYLRDYIRSDAILRSALEMQSASEVYLAHTRWASVGAINELNCHPLNNFCLNTPQEDQDLLPRPQPMKAYPFYGKGPWAIQVALNGDIDNQGDLRSQLEEAQGEVIDPKVTTDTKVIPLQIEKYLQAGNNLKESFRLALNDFEGSHAIAMHSNLEPDTLFLALRGSGQALYVGLGADQYVFSSEVYGLVEMTPWFIKMDGEHERIEGDPGTKGQIFLLNGHDTCSPQGIEAIYYDGYPVGLDPYGAQRAEITTRDIDRKGFPHFLLKEILEAPLSAVKTLRGKYRIDRTFNGMERVSFNLGPDIIPERLKEALRQGEVNNIFIIGQGTAAVAGAAIAEAMRRYLSGLPIQIQALKASDLSGFFLEEDLGKSLVIAVTQSGTTTDTNRAVYMARERQAHILAIVNRRHSDITINAEGIFYTSDGRDVEMSVASTKAFYSQIIAGYVLALYLAQFLRSRSDTFIARELLSLGSAAHLMTSVLDRREEIKASAWTLAKQKRYWAVVGSGPNKVAADEIRIKLSELCYKTISSDIIEDKKHIDLSSEPLIVVCAAGNPSAVNEDVLKDVAIFKAHGAAVVVITDEGEMRFDPIADAVIRVPRCQFPVSVILNSLAGHLWGYYAACSIDEEANVFRTFRGSLSHRMTSPDCFHEALPEILADKELNKIIDDFALEFNSRRNQDYLASMNPLLAADLALLLKYSTGKMPLELFWKDFEDKRVSSSPLVSLELCLNQIIEDLSRPIDAIRHQAKTVTVGTSRKISTARGKIFEFLQELNFSLENLTAKNILTARRIQNAIATVNGYTFYQIDPLDKDGKPTEDTLIWIESRGGVALPMKTRITRSSPLRGTKRSIASTGDMFAGLGRTDRVPIVIIPLLGPNHFIRNILLMHVQFRSDVPVEKKKEVIGDKLNRICDVVNEYNWPWDDQYLEAFPIEFLLGEAVDVIAAEIIRHLKHSASTTRTPSIEEQG